MTQVRAYLAMSLDGYVAGPGDDLTWLENRSTPAGAGDWAASNANALDFDSFLDQVGAILMGRRTYDIVAGFDAWPYRDIPMLVATHRPLVRSREGVEPAQGTLNDLIEKAKATAQGKDVYIDGAQMVRGALDTAQLDHLFITLIPTVLGAGISLFDGLTHPRELTVERVTKYADGPVQIHLVPGA